MNWLYERHVKELSEKILSKEAVVAATIEEVWEAWTTTDGAKSFFAENASVELKVGAPYEILFDMFAPEGKRGSEGCHVLSFLPPEMLTIEWNAPPDFGELRGQHTHVVILLEEIETRQTWMRLSQLGWGAGEKWDELYGYFDRAWDYVLDNLKKSFEG